MSPDASTAQRSPLRLGGFTQRLAETLLAAASRGRAGTPAARGRGSLPRARSRAAPCCRGRAPGPAADRSRRRARARAAATRSAASGAPGSSSESSAWPKRAKSPVQQRRRTTMPMLCARRGACGLISTIRSGSCATSASRRLAHGLRGSAAVACFAAGDCRDDDRGVAHQDGAGDGRGALVQVQRHGSVLSCRGSRIRRGPELPCVALEVARQRLAQARQAALFP